MSDNYHTWKEVEKIRKLLEKERSAKDIAKKTKKAIATVYRILQSMDKDNAITVRDTRTKDNKHLRLYKLKTKSTCK